MPDIAAYHPIVVHFVVALLAVGVVLRLGSLWKPLRRFHPAAALLILLGALATVVAVESGEQAHGPTERIPGARPAVKEHEEHGEQARTVFLVVAGLEVLALMLQKRRPRQAHWTLWVSAIVGAVGLVVLFEAAEHGGELVYSYAGGVGTRSGESQDVERLLLAGLYHQSQADRKAGNTKDAAELVALAAKRFPGDPEVGLLSAASLLDDRHDAAAALALLQTTVPPAGFGELRHGLLLARALKETGNGDRGRAILERLAGKFPQSEAVRRALAAY